MSLYLILKFLHILLAIVAVGFNTSYGIWLSRVQQQPSSASLILRGVQLMDNRFANPAYGLLLLTGVAMVFVGGLPWNTFWIDAAIVLWVITVAIGAALYTPALRRQIATLEAKGFESAEFRATSQRGQVIGLVNMVPILLILILMVFKPTF
jgi:uncharacterized membrane protein